MHLYLSHNQIVDVSPLAGLVHLKELHLGRNPIVDTSPLRSLPKSTKITGVVVVVVRDDGCCTIV
jgi:Leucine-rich repeat (LRR) protein